MHFTQAIVRIPSKSLATGLTSTTTLGKANYDKAINHHQHYLDALGRCGVETTILPAIEDYPDGCFVEDVAIVTEKVAICTRPGAKSRQGEVEYIKPTLERYFGNNIHHIKSPGSLEGGDVLRIDDHFYIGLSKRTNQQGAEQLITHLKSYGYTGEIVTLNDMLHLKTGVSYLGNNTLLVAGEFIEHPSFKSFKKITITPKEDYCANTIKVNGTLILPEGFSSTQETLKKQGFNILTVDTREFQKIDGGLSCLSLRF
jgi:dimethylargininase